MASWDGKIHCGEQMLTAGGGLFADSRTMRRSPSTRTLGIIRHYTREAGVRNLERELAAVCRKVAVEVVKNDRNARVKITSSSLSKYLGPPRFRYGLAETKPHVHLDTQSGIVWLAAEVDVVRGDLASPETLDAALNGTDAAFLLWPVPNAEYSTRSSGAYVKAYPAYRVPLDLHDTR